MMSEQIIQLGCYDPYQGSCCPYLAYRCEIRLEFNQLGSRMCETNKCWSMWLEERLGGICLHGFPCVWKVAFSEEQAACSMSEVACIGNALGERISVGQMRLSQECALPVGF